MAAKAIRFMLRCFCVLTTWHACTVQVFLHIESHIVPAYISGHEILMCKILSTEQLECLHHAKCPQGPLAIMMDAQKLLSQCQPTGIKIASLQRTSRRSCSLIVHSCPEPSRTALSLVFAKASFDCTRGES